MTTNLEYTISVSGSIYSFKDGSVGVPGSLGGAMSDENSGKYSDTGITDVTNLTALHYRISTSMTTDHGDANGLQGGDSLKINYNVSTGGSGTFLILTSTSNSQGNFYAKFAISDSSHATITQTNASSAPTLTTGFWLHQPTAPLPASFYIVWEDESNEYMLLTVNDNFFSPFTLIPKLVPVKDIQVGDLIRTTRGDLPLSAIMKSNTPSDKYPYVKFSKDCLGDNIPSEDLYITKPHPLSLGLVPNERLNNGIKDDNQEDLVFIHISAQELLNVLPGIEIETKDFESNFNLIFDQHTSLNIGGLEVITHHPVGMKNTNHQKLNFEQYQNKDLSFNPKDFKPFFITWKTLVSFKPEDMELKEFVRKCLTADENDKFKFTILDQDLNIIKF